MAAKRYRLNSLVAASFLRGGDFQFKLGYSWPQGDGTVYRVSRNAPTITVGSAPPGVVETDNERAQACIEAFKAPRNTERNGARRLAGNMFVEVTDITTSGDVDVNLDPIFSAHEGVK